MPLFPLKTYPFRAFLTRNGVAHVTESSGSVRVQERLDLRGTWIRHLPRELTVEGTLDISRTRITRLPEQLHVHSHLFLFKNSMTMLPRSLAVMGIVYLEGSAATVLPDGFHAHGGLDLGNSLVQELPEGLVVDGMLNLSRSRITRLPQSMLVGGLILPPEGLQDAARYLALYPGDVRFRRPDSGHAGLELRARLETFPDLLRVVLALDAWHQLRMWHNRDGTPEMHLERG